MFFELHSLLLPNSLSYSGITNKPARQQRPWIPKPRLILQSTTESIPGSTPALAEASGSGWCLKQGERVSSMESERWGSFPTLAPSACQNSNALPTPHSDFCGRCACFPREFTLAMQMCFTEAIAFCCVMQPGIKQYMLFGAFLKCKPEVTVELSHAAKNVNAMILAGKNISYPPSSHTLLLSRNFAKSFRTCQ